MNVLINRCWCSDSNWGGVYDCRLWLTIDYVKPGLGYHDGPSLDWVNLLDTVNPDTIDEVVRLKPEVIKWLTENVKDRTGHEHKQGWCVGTDEYNSNAGVSFSVFFHRRNDAMKFIERWSEYKKPLSYFNYFKDIRREFDFTTKRMKQVPR